MRATAYMRLTEALKFNDYKKIPLYAFFIRCRLDN